MRALDVAHCIEKTKIKKYKPGMAHLKNPYELLLVLKT